MNTKCGVAGHNESHWIPPRPERPISIFEPADTAHQVRYRPGYCYLCAAIEFAKADAIEQCAIEAGERTPEGVSSGTMLGNMWDRRIADLRRFKQPEPLYPNDKFPGPFHDLWTIAVGQEGYDKRKWNALAEQIRRLEELESLINTPEIEDFDKAIALEATHQVSRWGSAHDKGKNPEDWFWLVGYLAGKALAAQKLGDLQKAKHHTISAAAALRNWHAHIRTGRSLMRPGINLEDQK